MTRRFPLEKIAMMGLAGVLLTSCATPTPTQVSSPAPSSFVPATASPASTLLDPQLPARFEYAQGTTREQQIAMIVEEFLRLNLSREVRAYQDRVYEAMEKGDDEAFAEIAQEFMEKQPVFMGLTESKGIGAATDARFSGVPEELSQERYEGLMTLMSLVPPTTWTTAPLDGWVDIRPEDITLHGARLAFVDLSEQNVFLSGTKIPGAVGFPLGPILPLVATETGWRVDLASYFSLSDGIYLAEDYAENLDGEDLLAINALYKAVLKIQGALDTNPNIVDVSLVELEGNEAISFTAEGDAQEYRVFVHNENGKFSARNREVVYDSRIGAVRIGQ